MSNFLRWITGLGGVVLVGNFIVLRLYGDTLQSTHLFITRGTVFYPLAGLNLILGVLLLAFLVRDLTKTRKE